LICYNFQQKEATLEQTAAMTKNRKKVYEVVSFSKEEVFLSNIITFLQ